MISSDSGPKSYWCHSCKIQFSSNSQEVKCVKCRDDFCEQISQTNNPINYVPYRLKKEKPRNLTQHLQTTYFINQQQPMMIANEELFERIRQLLDSMSNKGAPPASKAQIQKLKENQHNPASQEKGQCSICQQQFRIEHKIINMPCYHQFHSKCLLTWLEHRNSCPVCRFQLNTDNADYKSQS